LLNALADEIFVYRRSLPWTMNIGYLGALFRLVESPEAPEEPTDFRTAENPVARAKQFALAHLGEPLTVQRLAAEAHLSPAHFTRLFRAHTGKSPIEWLAEKRLLQATQLLRYADMSLSDIAEQVGYADLPTFSKAFKRWLGMSPSIYRSKAGEVSVGKHWNDTLYT
jgi:AraC-like DNA-binding protein